MNKNKKKLSLNKITIEMVPGVASNVAGGTGGLWCMTAPTLTNSCASCGCGESPSCNCAPCVAGY